MKAYCTKEALEASRLKVVGKPTALEQAYIDGWNDALEAVINNFGACVEGIQKQKGETKFCEGLAHLGMNND